MLYNIKTGQIKTDDTYMDYYSFGTGSRTLLLIQGLSIRGIKGTALPAAHMYRMFADEFKVYVIDRRNDVPEDFTIWDIAEDILFVMDELGIEKASVFGASQGGMISQALAIQAPDRIEKAVLAVTLSRPNDIFSRVIGQWIGYAEKGDYESINREMFTLLYTDEYLEKHKRALPFAIKYVKPTNLKRFIILARSCIIFDSYEQLDKITCPVLVLGGKLDQVTTGEASEEIAEKLNCPIYMYEQYGHAVYEEAPDFNRRVLEFLN